MLNEKYNVNLSVVFAYLQITAWNSVSVRGANVSTAVPFLPLSGEEMERATTSVTPADSTTR